MSAIPSTAAVNPSPVDLLDGLPEARPGASCEIGPAVSFEIVHEAPFGAAQALRLRHILDLFVTRKGSGTAKLPGHQPDIGIR